METLFLTFAGMLGAPALAARDPMLAFLLGFSALVWALLARWCA